MNDNGVPNAVEGLPLCRVVVSACPHVYYCLVVSLEMLPLEFPVCNHRLTTIWLYLDSIFNLYCARMIFGCAVNGLDRKLLAPKQFKCWIVPTRDTFFSDK